MKELSHFLLAMNSLTDSTSSKLQCLAKCLRLLDTVLNVPSDSPERLSFINVLTILPSIEEQGLKPVSRGRRLVWSRIPAWGAGDPGFKSRRPHQVFLILN